MKTEVLESLQSKLSSPNGYKQTEVGLIPEDWQVKKLDEIVEFKNGKAHENSIVEGGEFIVINSKFISTEGEVYKSSNLALEPLHKGEIVMVMSDIPNGKALAKCFYIDQNNRYTLNQRICSLKAKNCSSEYLFRILNRNKYYLAFDSGSGQTNLRKQEVLNCFVHIPPTISEQTAIATDLSDADALIRSLEQLIEKKKKIKQGAMQELLRPKEGWVEMSLFQIAENQKELFDDGDWIESVHITQSGVRLVQTGNIGIGTFIEKSDKKFIYPSSFQILHCKEIRRGDLLICRLADPAGRSCILPDMSEERVVTSVDVTIFRPDEKKYNREFLCYILSTVHWLNSVSEMCGGTTHKRISRSALGKLRIKIPGNIQEQNSISSILVSMDNEISKLKLKLDKYIQLKQGMMQNLLTGKIRLI